ncbi:hypothetical protein IH992_28805 [Candidatus Poribacteria bacterium]|nr:hypothetical protein [Candidatus Poribacteria bacterium]
MKTIPIHITKKEYEWLSKKATQQKMTVAKLIEGMVRDAFLYQGEELPPYDWGEEGIPEGDPIEYDPDIGFVVIEKGEE